MRKKLSRSMDYSSFLHTIKSRIQLARISAVRSINTELIQLYWTIGRDIVDKQECLGWGKSIVEKLAKDLRKEFPKTTGYSVQNLWLMRQFFLAYREKPNLQQLAREIPWFSNVMIFSKVKDSKAQAYYLRATAQMGWSRNVLLHQIKANAYRHAVLDVKTHNFPLALPEYLAEQADEAIKSTYNLEFLDIKKSMHERRLEHLLVEKLKNLILELGYGFCFVGSQHKMTLGANEYYIDLLFYHRFLKSLVAIELKTGKFKPEDAGKMDFYLNLLNERERGPGDNPSIGIILCAEKEKLVVEFSLKTKINPIGVAAYKVYRDLPAGFKGKLPTRRQLAGMLKENNN